jgi:hypothetical protein
MRVGVDSPFPLGCFERVRYRLPGDRWGEVEGLERFMREISEGPRRR